MAKLLLTFHGKVVREYPLEDAQVWIGRKAANLVVIDNAAVSGEHARIVSEDGGYWIEDLASTNGTFLNGARITRERLYDGDGIQVGKHVLRYQDETRTRPDPAGGTASTTEGTGPSDGQATSRGRKPSGGLRVLSGKTDRHNYALTAPMSAIGSQADAAIRLTGWMAPDVAAIISRRTDGYFVSRAKANATLLVNGTPVEGRRELGDGDVIEVAGIRAQFYLRRVDS